uniref:EF-hand domain-containing protein n=2 Tax=Florenciella parvula TaxID=236787 RepID=A0A7S2D725_9STRA|mmetsp:Transcript_9754/g.20519  ORF Transcript_9754/g.20519 Transcript_9754/m.20519 type:complete len:270 (+) Transcript_9754:47-856(+)
MFARTVSTTVRRVAATSATAARFSAAPTRVAGQAVRNAVPYTALAAAAAAAATVAAVNVSGPPVSGCEPGMIGLDGLNFTQESLATLLRKTEFNMQEIRHLAAEYQKIDVRYGDGTISGDEFANYYSKKFELDHGQTAQLFRLFDVDGGGSIDFVEFTMTLSKLAKGSTGNRLGFFFYTADSDNSGSIDKAELMAMLFVLFRLGSRDDQSIASSVVARDKVATEIMSEADADRNGAIDVPELKAWIRRGSPHAKHCMELMEVFGTRFLQ